MNIRLQSVLVGTAISAGLTLFMWISKSMAVLIWITLPGWLLAWGTIIVLRGENWLHRDAIGMFLLMVGNAIFYSWLCVFILNRKWKE
jgi:hypothetical protein